MKSIIPKGFACADGRRPTDSPPKTRLARQNDHCLESPAGDARQRRRVQRRVGARHVGRRRRPSQRSRRATSLRRRRLSTLLDDDVSNAEISLECAHHFRHTSADALHVTRPSRAETSVTFVAASHEPNKTVLAQPTTTACLSVGRRPSAQANSLE